MARPGGACPAAAPCRGFPHDWSRSVSTSTRALALACALLLAVVCALTLAAAAHAVTWKKTGASTFGGPCETFETLGYRGAHLPTLWRSFAELGMGRALGGLPNRTRVRVLNPATGRRLTIRKRDIGAGGNPVGGLPRAIDLYWPVTRRLDPRASCSSWTGVVLYRLL